MPRVKIDPEDQYKNKNRTGKPIYVRPDIEQEELNSVGSVYPVEETGAGPSGRGIMPVEKYPHGHVRTDSWNHRRPMRMGRHVQTPHGPPVTSQSDLHEGGGTGGT